MGTVMLTDSEKLEILVKDLRSLMVYHSNFRHLAVSNHASNAGIETVDVDDIIELLESLDL